VRLATAGPASYGDHPIRTPRRPITVPPEGSCPQIIWPCISIGHRPHFSAVIFIASDMAKRSTDKLARVRARPDPDQWSEDEVMTLIEATAVFFPQGPLTLSSLRRAAAAGMKLPKWQVKI
jgi:hypothetical protein